jgi:hypothetical protein
MRAAAHPALMASECRGGAVTARIRISNSRGGAPDINGSECRGGGADYDPE